MAFRRGGEWEEHDDAVRWIINSVVIAFMVALVLIVLALPLANIIGYGMSEKTIESSMKFLTYVFKRPDYLVTAYVNWIKQWWNYDGFSFVLHFPWFPVYVFIITAIWGVCLNPHDFGSNVLGGSRLAETRDIKMMNLFGGFIVVLGKWKGKLLMLPETLSVLCVAPPGTGKTVGVVIPTILNSKNVSIIVNDPKPELCFKTSGHRAKEGPVFIINWGAEDDPSAGTFYPSWNPLSSKCMPPAGPARDLYIDSMNAILVEEPKGGADPHWSKTGRNALAGLINFVANKCERGRANDYFISKLYEKGLDKEDRHILESYYMEMKDPEAAVAVQELRAGKEFTLDNYIPIGTWENLPEEWVGQEACISMILDWMTESQMAAAADIQRRVDEGDQMAAMADPMKDMLDEAVAEAVKFGYAQRSIIELNQMAVTPDKERGSVLSTALTGIGIFKNAAVRQRTKVCDLTFKDMRGMIDPVDGEMKPISVYLSVNQVDARALGIITGTFIELMSAYLIANPPNFEGKDGKVGPFPALFVLDEFPQMPKLMAIKDGPAVGRGQKVSYLLIGQDLGQITGQYGKDDLETIITTTAAKVVLAQNNEQTAQRFEKMIGNRTVVVKSTSRTEGFSKQANPWASNVSRSLQGSAAFGAGDIMTMPADKQLVMMQGFFHRPILADAPRYYLDKKMLAECEIPSAPAVPTWIVDQRE